MGSHGNWKPLGDGSLTPQDPDKGLGHIVPIRTYNTIFLSLIALTAFTVGIATVDLGWANLPVALAIATLKAGIVTLFFMHMNYENKLIWGIVIYPIFIWLLMVLGTLGDESVKNKTERLTPFKVEQKEVDHSEASGHH
jgi:caa(3)-type oxidase, subunit IV